MSEDRQRVAGDVLLHPLTLAMIGVWLVNDHWLKNAHPSWLTGKLSDVTSLVVCPLLVLAAVEIGWPRLSRTARRGVLIAALAAVGGMMLSIKLFDLAAQAYCSGLGVLQWPVRALMSLAVGEAVAPPRDVKLAMDASDLLTLPSLAVAWLLGRGEH